MTKNWEKILLKKDSLFLITKKWQFTYPLASLKDVQDTGEAFSPQKRTSIYQLFSFFMGHFLPSWIRIQIRIHNIALKALLIQTKRVVSGDPS